MMTHLCRCWKKWPAKLKSCRVGWVLVVRRGNVDRKACATKEAARRRSISTRSPKRHNQSKMRIEQRACRIEIIPVFLNICVTSVDQPNRINNSSKKWLDAAQRSDKRPSRTVEQCRLISILVSTVFLLLIFLFFWFPFSTFLSTVPPRARASVPKMVRGAVGGGGKRGGDAMQHTLPDCLL